MSSESEIKGRVGIVAVVGKPNVGKSTLVNSFVGQKVSIVSNKAQTTRRSVMGIATEFPNQIIFVDTPGLHRAHTLLGKALNEAATQALDSDLVLVVVDGSKSPTAEDQALAGLLESAGWIDTLTKKAKPNLILCMNKMDLLKAKYVVDNVEAYTKLFGTETYMMTSFTRGDNLQKLQDMLFDALPEGPLLFPEDEFTNQPMRFLAAELVREKVLIKSRQEVPHSVATLVDDWEEEPRLTRIAISIVVEKQGQKAIIIGKGGAMLKAIGSEAREELEEILGTKVFLELFVKVREGWRQNPRMLRELEYDSN